MIWLFLDRRKNIIDFEVTELFFSEFQLFRRNNGSKKLFVDFESFHRILSKETIWLFRFTARP